jgi:hypothetical protein
MTRTPLVALAVAAALLPAGRAAAQYDDGSITRVAGSTPGLAGDGGPATGAQLNAPTDVAFLDAATFVVADQGNDRIRRVGADGVMTTVAGTTRGFSGDGGPADEAQLNRPGSVARLADGSLAIVDTFNQRVRRVAPDGTIATMAGSGTQSPDIPQPPGFGGDGGPATSARLAQPGGIAALPGGGFLLADTGNHRIRRVGPDGIITTIAGSTPGFGGDGGPAAAAQLRAPTDVAVADDGSILIADTGNQRVRRIEPDGRMVTLAGTTAGFSGDRRPGRFAQLAGPASVAPLTNGGAIVADTGNHRIRRITPLGSIFTFAGGAPGNAGDGGQAKQAQLNQPGGIALAPTGGGFLVADTANAVIRRVSDFGAIPPADLARSFGVGPAGGTVRVRPTGTPDFLAVREDDLAPMASEVDATAGRIELVTARDASGAQQTANAFDGTFTLKQADAGETIPTLRIPRLTGCFAKAAVRTPYGKQRKKKKPKKRKGPKRGLWVTDNGGRWRTQTGSVSAASIGTLWRTTLTCEGTRVTVREGRVAVRDRLRDRTRTVVAGRSILVKTRGRYRGR